MPRWLPLVLVLTGCDSDEESVQQRRLEFLAPGTQDPMADGATLEVYWRPQGVYGAHVDMAIVGVPVDEMQNFWIELTVDDEVVAHQEFLPTTLAVERPDGSVTISELPVVFYETANTKVDGRSAVLTAQMRTTPTTFGDLDVVLDDPTS